MKFEVRNTSLPDRSLVHGQAIEAENSFMLTIVTNDDETGWRDLEVGETTVGEAKGCATKHAVEIKRVE